MPTTVMVGPYPANVEPTVNLFLQAKVAPTTATSAREVELNDLPDVSFSVPPPLAPPTSAVPGELVPMTRTGMVKVPVPPPKFELPELDEPPPNCWPSDPAGVGDLSEVFDDWSSSLRDSCTETTFFRLSKASIVEAFSGVPPPLKPKKPLGETVTVVPVEDLTLLILLVTASRAISIEMESAIATARITTTPMERMEFLNALRMPRRNEFTDVLSDLGGVHPS